MFSLILADQTSAQDEAGRGVSCPALPGATKLTEEWRLMSINYNLYTTLIRGLIKTQVWVYSGLQKCV